MKIFISYASEDRPLVEPFYDRLLGEGFEPWIDCRKILPGQNWSLEIERAFTEAHVVLLFMSPRSVTKRGFVQREANDAIEKLRYKLPGDVYAIPLLLEPCVVPSHIADRLQYIDLRNAEAWVKIGASLALAAEQQKIELREGIAAGLFRIFTEKKDEPGAADTTYQISAYVPRFESAALGKQSVELNQIFLGRSATLAAEFRAQSWGDESALEFSGSNDLNDEFGIVFANEKVLSLSFMTHTFFAGAAHGNVSFCTFNFLLCPHLMLLTLSDFFSNLTVGLDLFSRLCLGELEKAFRDRTGMIADEQDKAWMTSGAGPKWRNFKAFTFDRTKFTVLFAPYQVSAYALGTWAIDIHYADLADVLIADGPHSFCDLVQ